MSRMKVWPKRLAERGHVFLIFSSALAAYVQILKEYVLLNSQSQEELFIKNLSSCISRQQATKEWQWNIIPIADCDPKPFLAMSLIISTYFCPPWPQSFSSKWSTGTPCSQQKNLSTQVFTLGVCFPPCSFQSQVHSHNNPFSVSVHGSTTFQLKSSYISHRKTSDMRQEWFKALLVYSVESACHLGYIHSRWGHRQHHLSTNSHSVPFL